MQREPRSFARIGAAMEVHRILGPGFLEAVYQEAFARELTQRGIPFRAEVELPVFSKGDRLSTSYRADFVHRQSVIVGTLFNFGAPSLQHKRFVFSPKEFA